MDEQALIRSCREGDKAAFEELLGCYEGLVFNLVHRYLGNSPEAADIAQEAMLRLYRRLGEFQGRSAFKTWVYRVVTNVCLDHLRRGGQPQVSLDELAERGVMPESRAAAADPEEALEESELRAHLRSLMAGLGPDHRMVLVLRDMEGLAYEEIAAIVGCSLGTVKSRLARAREALRRLFLASPASTGWVERRLRA
ncbi:MAG: RNA polymerase sigma factor [Patescibacteria group bacterium]